MGAAVSITRLDLTASELRKVASGEKDGAAARRILALTLVLDGVDRKMAAETCGMDRQTLRDWVHRYNIAGLAGLRNLKSPGPGSKLTARQQAELAELVEAGPDPAAHGVVRWRRVDLRDELQRRFGVGLAMPFSSSMAPAIIVLPRSPFPKTSPSCVCHPRHLNSTRSKTSGNKEARAPRSHGRSVVVLYNTERPHSSLDYRPPASEAVQWPALLRGPASLASPAMAPKPIMH